MLHWPYLYSYRILVWLRRLNPGVEPVCTRINMGDKKGELWIGGWCGDISALSIPSQGSNMPITMIDLTIELHRMTSFDHYLSLACFDCTAPTLKQLKTGVTLALERVLI